MYGADQVIQLDISELASELETLHDLDNQVDDEGNPAESELDETDRERLEELLAFEAELGCDLDYAASNGYTFIREDTFETYAQEFAEDIGAVGSDSQWPVYCIDWERAARELATDYSSIEFEGHDYYYREG